MTFYINWFLLGLAYFAREAASLGVQSQASSPQFQDATSEEADDQAAASSTEMQQELSALVPGDADDASDAAFVDEPPQQPEADEPPQPEEDSPPDGVDAVQQQVGDIGYNGLIVAQPPRAIESSKSQVALQQQGHHQQHQQPQTPPQMQRLDAQEPPARYQNMGSVAPQRPTTPRRLLQRTPKLPLIQVNSQQSHLHSGTVLSAGAAPAPAGVAVPAATAAPAPAGLCGVGDPVQVRPKEGCGIDTVNFGLYAKTFYGVNEKTYSFMADLIMTLRWTDPRVTSLIPAGSTSLTLSAANAKKMVWLPEVQVTNRAIRQMEVISTSVTITAQGEVEKVERVLVNAHCKYNLEMYPFDTQKLAVLIASTKYMLDEVVLSPIRDDGVNGMESSFLSGVPYESMYVETDVFEDIDGSLQKSRGRLIIKVERIFSKYADDFLTPALLTTAISWGVFYFPYVTAFVTPRLALSILALLTFVNQAQKIDNQMPDGVPTTWHSTFCQSVQVLMFCGIILNIAIESVHYQFKVEPLAKQMNHEAKLLIPKLGIVVWAISFALTSLVLIKVLTLCWIFGVMGTYGYFRTMALMRGLEEIKHKAEEAESKKKEPSLENLSGVITRAQEVAKDLTKAMAPFSDKGMPGGHP